uniref:Uncharacterized protein n=1 Tax=Steinernema glaseri TaxID=37863 RepID=A0A1I8A7Y4_9BILA
MTKGILRLSEEWPRGAMDNASVYGTEDCRPFTHGYRVAIAVLKAIWRARGKALLCWLGKIDCFIKQRVVASPTRLAVTAFAEVRLLWVASERPHRAWHGTSSSQSASIALAGRIRVDSSLSSISAFLCTHIFLGLQASFLSSLTLSHFAAISDEFLSSTIVFMFCADTRGTEEAHARLPTPSMHSVDILLVCFLLTLRPSKWHRSIRRRLMRPISVQISHTSSDARSSIVLLLQPRQRPFDRLADPYNRLN